MSVSACRIEGKERFHLSRCKKPFELRGEHRTNKKVITTATAATIITHQLHQHMMAKQKSDTNNKRISSSWYRPVMKKEKKRHEEKTTSSQKTKQCTNTEAFSFSGNKTFVRDDDVVIFGPKSLFRIRLFWPYVELVFFVNSVNGLFVVVVVFASVPVCNR